MVGNPDPLDHWTRKALEEMEALFDRKIAAFSADEDAKFKDGIMTEEQREEFQSKVGRCRDALARIDNKVVALSRLGQHKTARNEIERAKSAIAEKASIDALVGSIRG